MMWRGQMTSSWWHNIHLDKRPWEPPTRVQGWGKWGWGASEETCYLVNSQRTTETLRLGELVRRKYKLQCIFNWQIKKEVVTTNLQYLKLRIENFLCWLFIMMDSAFIVHFMSWMFTSQIMLSHMNNIHSLNDTSSKKYNQVNMW